MKDEFKRFLIEHDAYDRFCDNLKDYSGGCSFEEFINFCIGNKFPRTAYLSWAFDWDNTPQSYEYWDNLRCEWEIEIQRIIRRLCGFETEETSQEDSNSLKN